MIGVLPMKKLNETSVTMNISGLETDAANAKSIIDAINAGEVADAPIDPEMPEELDFNTDLVSDEFSDDTIGVEDDVVPEMDEDDKLLLEDDPIEDSETIIADLIKDGATTTTDIDGAIRECCELIGESADNIDFGKIHQLVEGKEKTERIVPNAYKPEFYYGLLDRMVQDCEYYLGVGYGFEKHLWAGSVERQIQAMREIYDALAKKPEWLTREDIDEYERKMLAVKAKVEAKREMLDEDTVKRGSSWVNKGKEGTHGKFKTKKEADAQRKAMFASGYKAESANETPDFEALCEAAMLEDDDADDMSYEEIYELLINGNIREYKEELQRLGRFGVNQYREWANDMGIDESDLRLDLGIPESGDYNEEDEDFEYLFSLLTNGNIGLYRQKLQALGRDGVKKYIAWASDMGIPVTELKLYMGLYESVNSYTEDDFVEAFEQLEDDAFAYGRLDDFRNAESEFINKSGVEIPRITWSGDYYSALGKEKAKQMVSSIKKQLGVDEDEEELNETSNPDCNYGTKPNPYLKDCKKTPCEMKRVKGFAARDKEQEGFPLRKDDGLSPKVVAIKESAENMLASARSDTHKEAIVRRMADKLLAEGISYSDAIKLLSDK